MQGDKILGTCVLKREYYKGTGIKLEKQLVYTERIIQLAVQESAKQGAAPELQQRLLYVTSLKQTGHDY